MNSPEAEGQSQEKRTLSTGKYTIEFDDGPSVIYKFDENENKIWVASASDPDTAMRIIEGLILVEHKRFYHPETEPIISTEKKSPQPPFLKKGEGE